MLRPLITFYQKSLFPHLDCIRKSPHLDPDPNAHQKFFGSNFGNISHPIAFQLCSCRFSHQFLFYWVFLNRNRNCSGIKFENMYDFSLKWVQNQTEVLCTSTSWNDVMAKFLLSEVCLLETGFVCTYKSGTYLFAENVIFPLPIWWNRTQTLAAKYFDYFSTCH